MPVVSAWDDVTGYDDWPDDPALSNRLSACGIDYTLSISDLAVLQAGVAPEQHVTVDECWGVCSAGGGGDPPPASSTRPTGGQLWPRGDGVPQ